MKEMKQTYVYRYIYQRVRSLFLHESYQSEQINVLVDEISRNIYMKTMNNHQSLDEQIDAVMRQHKEYTQKHT